MRRVVVYGASGHGKVVADILIAAGQWKVAGFIDDRRSPDDGLVMNLPVLGNWDWLQGQGDTSVALGIGVNAVRQRIAERCLEAGFELVTAVHPRATVSPSADVAAGSVIMAGAVINPEARLGRGTIVNTGAVVEHDCVLGDFAHLSPNAALGGGVTIGARTHLGVGAVAIPLVTIGDDCIVGAGASVIRDLPHRVVAVGVPTRIIKANET